ncbi:MAG: hypothetical protein ACOVMH_03945 [Flavobacterium sp.]|jgi:hypothetical protein
MEAQNDIRLRLRFYKNVSESKESVRAKFEAYKKVMSTDFLMKIRGNHIQFTVSGEKHRYWSPHLTIELEDLDGSDKQGTHIRGLFGPAQTLWTFFIFLHFILAGVFLTFSMFAFTNFTLKKPVTTDLIVMGLMLACWVLLYFIGRQTRENGYGQMEELEAEFNKIIN